MKIFLRNHAEIALILFRMFIFFLCFIVFLGCTSTRQINSSPSSPEPKKNALNVIIDDSHIINKEYHSKLINSLKDVFSSQSFNQVYVKTGYTKAKIGEILVSPIKFFASTTAKAGYGSSTTDVSVTAHLRVAY